MQTYLLDLFLGFSGRINRRPWWFGTLILVALSMAGTLFLDPGAYDLDRTPPRTPNWPNTIWQLALVIPGTALMVKRLNDRDWPHWLGYVFGALGAMLTLGSRFDLFVPGYSSAPETVVIVVVGLAFLYAFIETGFLRGTKGPNRYGPDPLPASEPAS